MCHHVRLVDDVPMKDNSTVVTATRQQLGPIADQITAWRTRRYLEAGFYTESEIAAMRDIGMPIESSRPDDYEVVAFGRSILATLSLRRPIGSSGWTTADRHRPTYGLEAVHGTSFLRSLPPVDVDRCWEAGRFLRDRNLDCSEAVVAVTAAAAVLLARLAGEGRATRLTGEVEPSVALRHLDAFGLPIVTGDEVESPAVDGLLRPRYQGRRLVPFAVDLTAITKAHRAAWRDLADRTHLLREPGRAA